MSGETKGRFLFCSNCTSGFELDDKEEMSKVPVYFGRTRPDAGQYLPFWAFDARLEIQNREARSGVTSFFNSPKGIARLFEERGAIRFYASAFMADLDQERPRALELTLNQPELEFIHPLPNVEGVEMNQQDARKVADYLFLLSEMEQRDTLRSLKYDLELRNAALILVGF
jgi:hypothetical protein